MAERNQESTSSEDLDDLFEPVLSDVSDDDMQELLPMSTEKQRLAAKRRRAEQRLEERRLRDELGYYDLRLDDY
ncbi:MAG: hypothetical protein KDI05_04705 [Halieaceae bacterium]|mgnify:CR=1 FL=1|nr:hypothetical protein [Halieaceae bacterium]MCP5203717.1 hypothetical protein [Pseudomonadales bacterium]